MTTFKNNTALIVASGRGQRMGGECPKQYQAIDGIPILRKTILALQQSPLLHHIKVVIHPDDVELYKKATRGLTLLAPTFGGKTRQHSVFNGLKSLENEKVDCVLIHDAARPFVTGLLVNQLIEYLEQHPQEAGVIPALPVTDTLKKGSTVEEGNVENGIKETISRQNLWAAQTPQVFRFSSILQAHRQVHAEKTAHTDDSSIAENANLHVNIIMGDPKNKKITTTQDLPVAPYPQKIPHVGYGYDVHKLIKGDGLFLGGQYIPCAYALLGHSDADVALHAITDALFGLIGEGDIGTHFPPNDSQWKGKDSCHFLKYALAHLHNRGGILYHIDLTIICEVPKIAPHRSDIVQTLSNLTGLSLEHIGLKATTTETLGFTGRKEGIIAQATVCALLPMTLPRAPNL